MFILKEGKKIETVKEQEETKQKEMRHRVWVEPCPLCDCTCSDEEEDEHEVEEVLFEIPGVKKEEIRVDVTKDRLRLVAPRFDSIEYFSEYELSCPMKSDGEPSASYEDGVLRIEVPVECKHPFRDAIKVKIK